MAGQDPKWQKDASDQNFDYMFKLLIIGNSSVGKTSFLFRYADDSFTSAFVSTVGIDFKVKTVFRNDKRVKLQIWVSVCNATERKKNLCSLHIHSRQTLTAPSAKVVAIAPPPRGQSQARHQLSRACNMFPLSPARIWYAPDISSSENLLDTRDVGEPVLI